MEETSLEQSDQVQPLKPVANPASTTGVRVMSQEEGRLYFKEKREKKENEERVKAERQKQFDTKLHGLYQSIPMKICTFLAYLVANVLPFGEILVGIVYFKEEDCPADKIALAMILVGVFGVLTIITHLYEMWNEKRNKKLEQIAKKASEPGGESSDAATEEEVKPKRKLGPGRCVSILFKIISLSVFIYACTIVFRLYSHVQYEKVENSTISSELEFYCHKVLFRYAFWSLASTFIYLGILFTFACALGCFGLWYVERGVSGSNINNMT